VSKIDEARLARALSRTLARNKRKLLAILGDPPDPKRVTGEFWEQLAAEMRQAITAPLARVSAASQEETARQLARAGIGFDAAQANEDAIRWLTTYGANLTSQLLRTTQTGVTDTLAAFFETSQTRRELVQALTTYFGPARAEVIAITEVTRAAANGKDTVRIELRKEGITMYSIWQTRADERVCPICGPLNQKDVTDTGLLPPAHPRCRCGIALSLTPGDKPPF
jgi:hypothetical protein